MKETRIRAQSSRTGFTLIEIMIVVAIIGLLAAAVTVKGFKSSRDSTNRRVCILNLRNIKAAVQRFQLENNKADSDAVSMSDIKPLLDNEDLVCPAGGKTMDDSYAVSDCGSAPTCISKGGGEANKHVLVAGGR